MNLEQLSSYCRRRGLIFQSSEIYEGFAGFFDFGPVGVEIKNNIKREWWKRFVHERENVVGIDGSIIANPEIWKASGHVDNFADPLTQCVKCRTKWRADHLIEDALKISTDGMKPTELSEIIKKHNLKCPTCKGELESVNMFNLMFQTAVGPTGKLYSYLRPETAQVIFADYKPVLDTGRVKLPFGIAQIGKAFRNEISPRNFIFRCREFEQMEIEFFVEPEKKNDCDLLDEVNDIEVAIFDRVSQKEKKEPKKMSIKEAIKKKIFVNSNQAYWIAHSYKWLVDFGIKPENLRLRQHLKEELSHYAEDTWDIEYNYPFGWKELMGCANRTTFDLTQHQKFSNKNLEYFDEESKRKFIPYVAAEPSLGVERAFLTFIIDALVEETDRTVLKIHPKLAPYMLAVFPLMKKPELSKLSEKLFKELKTKFHCFYDDSGSIGRRYRRVDEIGVKWCITIDYDSLKNEDVTIRDRDTMTQERVKIDKIQEYINSKLN